MWLVPWSDKEVQREYQRAYYQRNKEAAIAKADKWNKKNRIANREKLAAYLSTHPCVDCGETDIVVLEFDHKDDVDKVANIGDMLLHYSWTKIEKEIAKCDVRCANDHRRRTSSQFNYWRTPL